MQQLNELSNLTYIMSQHIHWVGTALFVGFGSWQVIAKKRNKSHAAPVPSTQVLEPIGLHPEFDRALCISCGSCAAACPEEKVIQMIQGRPELVPPSKCVGHGECERICPGGAISLVFGTRTRGKNIPRISASYESNVSGLYVAGELGGMGLIRNAIKQGTLAARHAIQMLDPSKKTDVDLLIVGAGPAGFAAALAALEKKKTYLCIEQGSLGGTVYNYPRQKIVMTHPAQLPLIGTMKFRGNHVSKEELLEFWQNAKARTGLKIQEQTRFEKLVTEDGMPRYWVMKKS
ncbi:NAD(P)-binding domain-containing protein [Bdellovibrionota bacterium FG-2]